MVSLFYSIHRNTSSHETKYHNLRKQNNSTEEGIFALAIEANHNLSVNALYGNDTIGLSYLGSAAPSLDEQLVGGIASKDLYTGMIGLNPASTNFTDYNNPIPSYMST